MPRQTQYARASGPRPRTRSERKGPPRRKVNATTSSVLATPRGASRTASLRSLVRSTVSSTSGSSP